MRRILLFFFTSIGTIPGDELPLGKGEVTWMEKKLHGWHDKG